MSGARETHAGGHPARSRITPVTSAPVRQQLKHHERGAPPRLAPAPLASGAAEPAHACSSASAGAKATVPNPLLKQATGLRPVVEVGGGWLGDPDGSTSFPQTLLTEAYRQAHIQFEETNEGASLSLDGVAQARCPHCGKEVCLARDKKGRWMATVGGVNVGGVVGAIVGAGTGLVSGGWGIAATIPLEYPQAACSAVAATSGDKLLDRIKCPACDRPINLGVQPLRPAGSNRPRRAPYKGLKPWASSRLERAVLGHIAGHEHAYPSRRRPVLLQSRY